MSSSDAEAWDVFISYAHADKEQVTALAEALHARGLQVFFDAWELGAGEVVAHRLDAGLRNSHDGILVVSATSVARPWVLQEYAVLLQRSVELGRRLIPVVIEAAELPPMLASRNWIDLRGKSGAAYAEAVDDIARALRGQRRGPPVRPGPAGIP